MSVNVYIAMFGWIPVVLALFAWLPARRAVLAGLLIGWLFLPNATFALPKLPDYNKMTAVALGVFVGAAIFDGQRFFRFQFRWFDWPMVIWCVVPLATALSNGLGVWYGLSSTFSTTVTWGLPYLLGRLYFSDQAGMRELAVALFIGGLIYIPFCLYEVRMAPVLHHMVYGYNQHSFAQVYRLGGWRPMVFLQHGLAVGMWMAAASMVGIWLWRTGQVKRLYGVPAGWLVAGLVVTTILCRSFGSWLLLAGGVGMVWLCQRLRSPVPLLLVILVVPTYLTARVVFDYRAPLLIDTISVLHERRASSLSGRIEDDAIILDHALKRPLLGWGGYNRFRAGAEEAVLPDTLWSITIGQHGLIGLVSLFSAMLIPSWLVVQRMRRRGLTHRDCPAAFSVATVIALFALDCMSNAMLNPVFATSIGGLAAHGPRKLTRPQTQKAPGDRPAEMPTTRPARPSPQPMP